MKTELKTIAEYVSMYEEADDELKEIIKDLDIPHRYEMKASELAMLYNSNHFRALMIAYDLGFLRGMRYGKKKRTTH